MNKLIGVTIGDIKGIGIHILINEWKKNNIKNFILITNYSIFEKFNLINKKRINVIKNNRILDYKKNKFNILNIKSKNQYTNIYDSLEAGYKLTKNYKFIGILTLPLNKIDIKKFVNKEFIDQTSFYSKLEKVKESNMIFIYKNKFFIPLTTHIELKKVSSYYKNQKDIYIKIISLIKTLKNDFGIKKPKILMAGINPHAGENGLISNEDDKLLKPIIKKLKKNMTYINGPVSGDTIIIDNNLLKFDTFIFTFHDQALIPFKIISNYNGVNFTSALSIIRVSPSHGTARNLVSKNLYSSKGIINCFKVIRKIHNNRKKIV